MCPLLPAVPAPRSTSAARAAPNSPTRLAAQLQLDHLHLKPNKIGRVLGHVASLQNFPVSPTIRPELPIKALPRLGRFSAN